MGASLEIVPSSVAKGSADRIITNELVTKSLTYAFLEDRAGTVTVKLSRDGEIHLVVEDDGVGCADGEDRSGQVDISTQSAERQFGSGFPEALLLGRYYKLRWLSAAGQIRIAVEITGGVVALMAFSLRSAQSERPVRPRAAFAKCWRRS
jgi:hypothetical protein